MVCLQDGVLVPAPETPSVVIATILPCRNSLVQVEGGDFRVVPFKVGEVEVVRIGLVVPVIGKSQLDLSEGLFPEKLSLYNDECSILRR